MSLEKLVRGKVEPTLKQLVVKAPVEVTEEIERIANEKGFSRAEVIVEMLTSGLETYRKIEAKLARAAAKQNG